MTLRGMLLLTCAALLLGSGLLLVEGLGLASAIAAASRGEPLLLPEGTLVGTVAFFAVLPVGAGALLWPILGRIDRRDGAAAAELASNLARFRREERRTRGKARRAEVARERSRWETELKRGRPSPGSPHWASWAGALLAALVIAALAAALAPDILPRWLRARGHEPCASLDETRWVRTRQSRAEVRLSGWALLRDCVGMNWRE